MGIWTGYDPSNPYNSYNLKQYAIDVSDSGFTNVDGSQVSWWETGELGGVTFTPEFCGKPRCEDLPQECEGCEDCGPDGPTTPDEEEECNLEFPEPVNFQPFWVKGGFRCSPAGRDPNELYRTLDRWLDRNAWPVIGQRYHQALQEAATDISNNLTAGCIADAIGTLVRARGISGLGPGMIVAPGYAMSALEIAGAIRNSPSGLPTTSGGIPVIADSGFPVTGPAGAPPPGPGTAWIYITHGPPRVAFRNVRYPHNGPFDFRNTDHRQKFWRDDCADAQCFEPQIKRMGIVTLDPCGTFAVPISICGG